MTAARKHLCAVCETARDIGGAFRPVVGQPVTGERDLYDVRSQAKCPTCGALWHRDHKGVRLVDYPFP